MTRAQRLALARAFEALQERIATKPVQMSITRKHYLSNRASQRGTTKRRRTANIAE